MSSSNDEEIVVELAQEIREHRIIRRFDFSTLPNSPDRGAVILRASGFGVVGLIGIEPDRARVGDIAVEVTHSGYLTRARVWLKVVDGTRGWTCTSELQSSFYSLPTSRSVDPEIAERQSSVPRVGDLWIPSSEVSPNHFVRLYVPSVEDLFAEGDRLVRIEHSGSRSRVIS